MQLWHFESTRDFINLYLTGVWIWHLELSHCDRKQTTLTQILETQGSMKVNWSKVKKWPPFCDKIIDSVFEHPPQFSSNVLYGCSSLVIFSPNFKYCLTPFTNNSILVFKFPPHHWPGGILSFLVCREKSPDLVVITCQMLPKLVTWHVIWDKQTFFIR